MPLYRGGQRIAKLYRGATPIVRAYQGAALVFGAAGAVPEISFITASSTQAGSTANTFTSVSLGAAHAGRVIAVVVGTVDTAARTFVSGTINGVSATLAGQSFGTSVNVLIMYAHVPAGTSGDIIITYNAGVSHWIDIGVFRIVGLASLTHAHAHNPSGGGDASRSVTLNIPDQGVAVVGAAGANATNTWTNATGQYATGPDANNGRRRGAMTQLETGNSSYVITNVQTRSIAGVVFR